MATAGHATMLYYARHGRVGLGIGMAYGALLSEGSLSVSRLHGPRGYRTTCGWTRLKWCSQCFSSIAKDMAYRFRFYIIKAVSVFISRTK